jgi:hypothetical protein
VAPSPDTTSIISRIGNRVVAKWDPDELNQVIAQLRLERSFHCDPEPDRLLGLAEEIKLRTSNQINHGNALSLAYISC